MHTRWLAVSRSCAAASKFSVRILVFCAREIGSLDGEVAALNRRVAGLDVHHGCGTLARACKEVADVQAPHTYSDGACSALPERSAAHPARVPTVPAEARTYVPAVVTSDAHDNALCEDNPSGSNDSPMMCQQEQTAMQTEKMCSTQLPREELEQTGTGSVPSFGIVVGGADSTDSSDDSETDDDELLLPSFNVLPAGKQGSSSLMRDAFPSTYLEECPGAGRSAQATHGSSSHERPSRRAVPSAAEATATIMATTTNVRPQRRKPPPAWRVAGDGSTAKRARPHSEPSAQLIDMTDRFFLHDIVA